MLRINRNISVLIILIILKKFFWKKSCTDLDIGTNMKERPNKPKITYNKQRNVYVSLLHKTKTDCFDNLDTKIMKENRKFWKTGNSLFAEKSHSKESIHRTNKDEIIRKKWRPSKKIIIFSSIVKKLGIENITEDELNLPNADDPKSKAIPKYKKYFKKKLFFFGICW